MDFIEHGDTETARTSAKTTIASNTHVLPLLLGCQALPEDHIEYVGMGDISKAAAYVQDALDLWRQIDGPYAG